MIRPLRKRQLHMQSLLALLLTVGMVQGLRSRQTIPTTSSSTVAGVSQASPLALELARRFPEAQQQPDVLVYLSPAAPAGDSLPESAQLLGSLAGLGAAQLTLPTTLPSAAPQFILYSLAHQTIVATGPVQEGE